MMGLLLWILLRLYDIFVEADVKKKWSAAGAG
jgi:hypothetical protein